MKHSEQFEGAGSTYVWKGEPFEVEDYWDRVYGESWGESKGNPAALNYAVRAAVEELPWDDEVVYGKRGYLGHLVHVSELTPFVPTMEGISS